MSIVTRCKPVYHNYVRRQLFLDLTIFKIYFSSRTLNHNRTGVVGNEDDESNTSANSLKDAILMGSKVKVLNLMKSEDLVCMNLMCEKVGDPCICRLSRALERTPNLKHLNLSGNRLSQLPDIIWNLKDLQTLDLSDNLLESRPPKISLLQNLVCLNISKNPIPNESN
mmetsp:Transcript_22152/g.30803  ORF Transcript_22152/g.30803 Transcript_22152/m.30803 type:complete len:168 (+) Transcript_22152:157-660(+)